jgi:hypothetical protein
MQITQDAKGLGQLAGGIMKRFASLTFALGLLLAATPSLARITRIEISRVESPTFQGTSFGAAGQYEKLMGRAFGEVDPQDLQNRRIVDIEFAPLNVAGKVEYSVDIVILRPIDAAKANGRLFYELVNRGTVLSLRVMNDATTATNDPTAAVDAGNGFLMREGYNILLSGWDATAPAGAGRLLMNVPVASNADGSPLTGPSFEELVIDNSTTQAATLSYPAAVLDTAAATLTMRRRYTDAPQTIAPGSWQFASDRSIRLLPQGTAFQQGMLYELAYQARSPLVAGLGLAAVRDLAAFMRRAKVDAAGNANPLAGRVQFSYAFGVSQPARFMRDFIHLGFNRDEDNRRAFDGVLNWIGGASGGFFNFRFAQPARTHRQHIGRKYPEREFPFAEQLLFDPVTRQLDGRLLRCSLSRTCPKILEVNSANEYWVKGGSLLHTDPTGHDLIDPDNVRLYLFSGFPHSPGTGLGMCQQPLNPMTGGIGLRAQLTNLDQWVSDDRRPPASRVPRRFNGSLVSSLPQQRVGFPAIPGVTYNGLMTTGDLFNFGPQFNRGIVTVVPPVLRSSPYPVFVPRTDEDGNEVAGVRFPAVEVPTATYTGWALRAAPFAGDDLCDAFGQAIPFAKTQAERVASGDPRLSLQERYPSNEVYVNRVTTAARRLLEQRLMLQEDVDRAISAAQASSIGQ